MPFRLRRNHEHGLFDFVGVAYTWGNPDRERQVVILRSPAGDLVCVVRALFEKDFEEMPSNWEYPAGLKRSPGGV